VTPTNHAWVTDPDSTVTGNSAYALLGILPGQDAVYVFVEGPGEPHRWPQPPPAWVPQHLRLTTSAGTPVAFRGGGKHGGDRSTLSYATFDQPPARTGPLSLQLDVGDELAFAARAVALPTGTAPATGRIWLVDDASRRGDSAYRVLGGVEGREWLYIWTEGPGWQPPPGGQPAEPDLNLQLTVLHAGEALPARGTSSGINRRRSLVNCQVDRPAADVIRLDVVLTVNGTHELTATMMSTDSGQNIG
jgi:hypothetical protein